MGNSGKLTARVKMQRNATMSDSSRTTGPCEAVRLYNSILVGSSESMALLILNVTLCKNAGVEREGEGAQESRSVTGERELETRRVETMRGKEVSEEVKIGVNGERGEVRQEVRTHHLHTIL